MIYISICQSIKTRGPKSRVHSLNIVFQPFSCIHHILRIILSAHNVYNHKMEDLQQSGIHLKRVISSSDYSAWLQREYRILSDELQMVLSLKHSFFSHLHI